MSGERRLAGWQRAVRWLAWLTFLGLAVWNSQGPAFSAVEWVALVAAIAFSIWCMARPLGGPKVDLTKPADVRGTFHSRASWGLLLIGTLVLLAGIAGAGAACYDMATGRATFGDVGYDIGIFIEGWFVQVITGFTYDAELEKTHAYALFVLIVPGLLVVWINAAPIVHRGSEFRVEPDGSVQVHLRDGWEPLPGHRYPGVVADGTVIRFTPAPDGTGVTTPVTLPQARVFRRENGARLPSKLAAEFFAELLTRQGFAVDTTGRDTFTAQRS